MQNAYIYVICLQPHNMDQKQNDESNSKPSKPGSGYGSIWHSQQIVPIESDELCNNNDLMGHHTNERYIHRIRQQSRQSNGPVMVSFPVARSRRRCHILNKHLFLFLLLNCLFYESNNVT